MATAAERETRHEREAQWLSYKFDRYREDGTNPSRAATVEEHRHIELPIPLELRHSLEPYQGPAQYEPFDKPNRPDLNTIASAAGLSSLDAKAWQALQNTTSWFHGSRLTFRGVLGWGESNLALHYTHNNGRVDWDFVLKVSLNDPENDPRIRKEGRMLRKARRSQHVVKTIPPGMFGLRVKPLPTREPPEKDDSSDILEISSDDEDVSVKKDPKLKFKRKLRDEKEIAHRERNMDRGYRDRATRGVRNSKTRRDDHLGPFNALGEEGEAGKHDYLLLEYMPNGSLDSFIGRLVEKDQVCPNRVLWSFWACLVRACIAMAYPVHKFHPRRNDPNFAGPLSEMVPVNETQRKYIRPMVHWAIDPSNVLIGRLADDIEHDEHEDHIVPILKLGGFGQAELIKTQKRNWYYERRRTCGKHGFYAPEQFIETWDKIEPELDGETVCEEPLIGNYGPATNVWGIAMTLLCVITRCKPLMPPRASRVKLMARKGDHSTEWWNHYTYGAMLLHEPDDKKWSYVDEELLEVLAKCLARDPAHRPSLKSLLDLAVAKCEEDGPYVCAVGEEPATDEMVSEWMAKMLKDVDIGPSTGA